MMINEKMKRVTTTAITPTRGSTQAAGWDLYADVGENTVVKPGETVKIGTGIAVAIPDGHVGLVFARTGLATKNGLAPANKVGVIDSDYRGEIFVPLHNHSETATVVSLNQRIAQLVVPYANVEIEEVESLSETARGEGGFGSTGK